jgi:hypothetical protein
MRMLVLVLAVPTSLAPVTVAAVSAQAPDRLPHTPVVWAHDAGQGGPGASWHARLFSALGGAALGAGVGYFSSQVFRGDWDEEPGRYVDRSVWAAVGGSLGLAVGFSFPVGGRGLTPETAGALPGGLPGGRFRIVAADFRGKGVSTADDVVRLLRPEWLIERGVNIFGESPGQGLLIYLDEVKLGGVGFLRDVSAQTIQSIHYFDAAAATFRWGAGHDHGVILIIAEGGRSGSANDAAPR